MTAHVGIRWAAGAATLVIAVVLFAILSSGEMRGSAGGPGAPALAVENAVPVRELDELAEPPSAGAVPGLEHPSRRSDPASASREGRKRDCPAAGAVAVEVHGLGCERAARVARSRPADDASEIAGLICTKDPGALSISCLDPTGGGTVTVTSGPGGRDLRDCGQAPVGADATLVVVRANIDCRDAMTLAFDYHDDPASRIGRYSCRRQSQGGVGVVRCAATRGEVAFVEA